MRQRENSTRWSEWLDAATGRLRSHPDYDQVRQELLDHLEDRAADLVRLYPDMSPEEVEHRALAVPNWPF